MTDRPGGQGPGGAGALVVGRLLGQAGEEVTEAGPGEAQPAAFAREAEQHLGHGQADQLGVGELRRPAGPPARAEHVVGGYAECGDEGVEVGGRQASWVDGVYAPPILGALALLVSPTRRRPGSESLV